MVRAVAEAVDHSGRQQHADDAQDGDEGEDQVLGGLRLAVLGGNLLDLVPLQKKTLTALTGLEVLEQTCRTWPFASITPSQKRSLFSLLLIGDVLEDLLLLAAGV